MLLNAHGDLSIDDADARAVKALNQALLAVGTGASCIYPLIGAREYGWRFAGSETDPACAARSTQRGPPR